MSQTNLKKLKELCYQHTPRISNELFCLTYGAFVQNIMKSISNVEDVNQKLFSVGISIGTRMADELLAISNIRNCSSFTTTLNIIVEIGFYMFFGITPKISPNTEKENSFLLELWNNPLENFVELPKDQSSLSYSEIICGILKGSLLAVSIDSNVKILEDKLKGKEVTKIQVDFLRVLDDGGVISKEYEEE
eukprot:snap_masked-scaffold_55-processed-gene-1.17-mRNA-1 protein AED:0.08 eAED:0.08 QI:0/-1/0/1/-1/1/1/0/190